jgi:hypothetical protein
LLYFEKEIDMSDQFSDLNNVLAALSQLRSTLKPEEQGILDQLIMTDCGDDVSAHRFDQAGVPSYDQGSKPAADPRNQPRSTDTAAEPRHVPEDEVEAHRFDNSSNPMSNKSANPGAQPRSTQGSSMGSTPDDEVEAHRFDLSSDPTSNKAANPAVQPRSSTYGASVTISFDSDAGSYKASTK